MHTSFHEALAQQLENMAHPKPHPDLEQAKREAEESLAQPELLALGDEVWSVNWKLLVIEVAAAIGTVGLIAMYFK